MPLKLVPPRKGKSPNFTIRGTHLRVYVDKSSGTDKRSVARDIKTKLERAIELGEYPPREVVAGPAVATFLSAAVNYMETGHSPRYIPHLIKHFGETPLADFTQEMIDNAAVRLHPNVTPCSRNRYVYAPVSAILRHAKIKLDLKRPKGSKGRVITDALEPTDAFAIIRAAKTFDPQYAALLTFLLYTGCRIGEALALRWDAVRLDQRSARVRMSKNGDPRELHLRQDVCDALASLPKHRQRVFTFHHGGDLKHKLIRAKLMVLGLECPKRRTTGWRQPPNRLSWLNHHSFCHTWATWMRRYGGLDEIGLAATGRWRDPRSARRYAHAVARDEWQRVEVLPSVENPWKRASGDDK